MTRAKYSGGCDANERQEFVPFIRELAAASGELIRGYYMGDYRVQTKSDATPVTAADREAEALMRELIERRYPAHGIVGEEYGESNAGASYRWVLDPIDGTKSFVANCYLFGTLIALLRDGRPILGAIHNPLLKHLLIGDGREARLNDRAVRVSERDRIEDAVLLTTSHWEVFQRRDGPAFEALSRRARIYRTWGDCMGYFLVATGGADIMFDSIVSPWDIQAIVPVVEGAGGAVSDWYGGDPVQADSLIATNGVLHDAVVAGLNRLGLTGGNS